MKKTTRTEETMGFKIRGGRIIATVAVGGVLATAVVISATSEDAPDSNQLRLASFAPVISEDKVIEYDEAVVDDFSAITSVAVSVDGMLVTNEDTGELGVSILNETGTEVAEYADVAGIALASDSDSIAAWATQEAENGSFEIVAVSTSTGRELGRMPATDGMLVMGISGGTVALSDGDASYLWQPGKHAALATFVADDFYIMGLTEDRVVSSDLNGMTIIQDRTTGKVIATLPGLQSWDLAAESNQLAGATESGAVQLVDLTTGVATDLPVTIEAAGATFGADDALLVTPAGDGGEGSEVAVCEQDEDCVTVSSDYVQYLPNSGLGQLLAMSS